MVINIQLCVVSQIQPFFHKKLLLSQEEKMPQSGVGSMQGKNTGNMHTAVFASSMNKSLDPTPI